MLRSNFGHAFFLKAEKGVWNGFSQCMKNGPLGERKGERRRDGEASGATTMCAIVLCSGGGGGECGDQEVYFI